MHACCTAENYRITENWAAYIDPTTGEGVGIYTPVAQTITCYRVGKVSSVDTSAQPPEQLAMQLPEPSMLRSAASPLAVQASFTDIMMNGTWQCSALHLLPHH